MVPNFLIIGAARCGTTALYNFLSQHPEIYTSPVKEPNYFVLRGKERHYHHKIFSLRQSKFDLDSYQDLFKARSSEQKAVGEASPLYLFHPNAAKNIYALIPSAKIIVLLRHPVDRLFSHFAFNVRRGRERLAFSEAIKRQATSEDDSSLPLIPYLEGGLFANQLCRYFNLFPKDQIRVCLHGEFNRHPLKTAQSIFSFLKVKSDFVPTFRGNINASAWRNFSDLQVYRSQLIEYYKPSVESLQELLDQDFSHWLK